MSRRDIGGRGPVACSPLFVLLLLAFVLVAATSARAQDADGEDAFVGRIETAPVTIDGESLFRVRGITALPAAERARRIRDGLVEAARAPGFSPDDIEVVEGDALTELRWGDRRLLVVAEADAQLEGVDRRVLVEVYETRVRGAIEAFRADRDPSVLLQRSLLALTAAAVLVIVLGILLWVFKRVNAALERTVRRSVERVQIQRFQLLRADRVWSAVLALARALRIAILLALVFAFLQFVLGLYPWTRHVSRQMTDFVTEPLLQVAEGVVGFVPNLFFLVFVVLLTRFALKSIRLFFSGIAAERIRFQAFEPEWSWPTYRIVRFFVVAFAVVIAFPYLPGSDSGAFRGVSIFLGIVFSLGSTSVIANVIAGYTMTYRRAFRLGDRVRIGDVVGDVAEIRLLVTHLRTPKNEEVVVPNSQILSQQIVNYSSLARRHGLLVHTTVGIGYEVPWRQVEALLLRAARDIPGTVAEPVPFVLQRRLGDFAVEYEINVGCDDATQMGAILSELHRRILDTFNEHGVAIMTPSYVADPPEPKVVPPAHWYDPPAAPPEDPVEAGA